MTKLLTYRVTSHKANGKLVHSYQCSTKMEVAVLIAKIEQAGLVAKCSEEWA